MQRMLSLSGYGACSTRLDLLLRITRQASAGPTAQKGISVKSKAFWGLWFRGRAPDRAGIRGNALDHVSVDMKAGRKGQW